VQYDAGFLNRTLCAISSGFLNRTDSDHPSVDQHDAARACLHELHHQR
jgi:hypothetical protein